MVWQSARIVSAYRPRETLAQLFRQQLQYGYWKPFVMRKHGQAAALRQLAPGAFVAALALSVLLGLVWPAAGRAAALLGNLYGVYVLAVSLAIARDEGYELLLRLPLVIVSYHAGYGLGTLCGWFDVLRGRSPSPAFGTLTR